MQAIIAASIPSDQFSKKDVKAMTRREFAKGAAGAAAGILAPAAVAAAGKAAAQTNDLHWATATALRDKIARKDVSVTEVVQHLLGRADALRSEECRVGKEWVSPCRTGWS